MACASFGLPDSYRVVRSWVFRMAGLFSIEAREIRELLPRYAHKNLFVSSKFKSRFPDFEVTTYDEGLNLIHRALEAQERASRNR